MDSLLCFRGGVVLWIWSGLVVCQECDPLSSNWEPQNLGLTFSSCVGAVICYLQILLVSSPTFHTLGER